MYSASEENELYLLTEEKTDFTRRNNDNTEQTIEKTDE